MAAAQLIHSPAPTIRRWPRPVALLVVLALTLIIGLAMGGEPGHFAVTGLTYAPAIVLVGLLQLRRWRAARVLSWIWFWLLMVAIASVALGLTALSLSPNALEPSMEQASSLVSSGVVILGILVLGGVIAASSLWVKLGRRLGAHLDGVEPAHAQGTVGLLLVSALTLVPLALLGGRAPLQGVVNGFEASGVKQSDTAQLLEQVYAVAWTVVLALWASAWPARVDLSAALRRLGLGLVRKRDLLPLLAITVITVGVGTALEFLNQTVLIGLGWPLTDGDIVTRLVPAARMPAGALLLAVCAGTSEELIFRGLLQPRFGWLLANVGFAAAHAFQYGLDGLVVVFALGAVLAFVRQRWNTSGAICVHVGYDALLLLVAAVAHS